MRRRRLRRGAAALLAATIGVSASAGEGGVEVLRGSQLDRDAPGGASETSHGVEVIGGSSPDPVDFDTHRFELSGERRQRIRGDIDRMIRIYRESLRIDVSPAFTVQLAFYGEARDFVDRAGGSRSIHGFYRHATREAVVSAEGEWDRVRETALHEASHAIVMDRAPGTPPWLNEGLAEYFEGLQRSQGHARIPLSRQRLAVLHALESRGRAFELTDLIGLRQGRWQRLPELALAIAYDQAWSLVACLMEDALGRRQLADMLADFAEPGSDRQSRAVVERHHPGGIAALEQRWRRWLARRV